MNSCQVTSWPLRSSKAWHPPLFKHSSTQRQHYAIYYIYSLKSYLILNCSDAFSLPPNKPFSCVVGKVNPFFLNCVQGSISCCNFNPKLTSNAHSTQVPHRGLTNERAV